MARSLRTFYRYLAVHHPEMLAEAQRVEAIPTKRAPVAGTVYLERDEIETLFQMLPRDGSLALRDRALLLFLYNTGARVQEVADVRLTDVDLREPYRVRLHGKGDKWRSCPIWPETAELLKQLVAAGPVEKTAPVFRSQQRKPLTRFGIYKIVKRHTALLQCSALGEKQGGLFPHAFRHSAAVHLLEAGVEVNVIRAWLGHVNLDTTNRYAEITLRTKQAAVAACTPPVDLSAECRSAGGWRKDADLLKWLESL